MLTFQMLVRNFPVCSLALEHLRRWLLYNAWELSMDSPSPLQVLKASLQLWLATWKAWRSYTGLRVAWKWLWLLKWGKSMVLGWINTPSSSSRCRFSLSQQQLWATLFFILLGDSGSQEPSPGIRWVCVCHCFFFNTLEPPCCGSWGQSTCWAPELPNSFVPQEGESVIFKMLRDVSLSSLKLSKETAKSKQSGESNWSCLANFVSYKFYSLNCSAAVTRMYWRRWES